jgi:ribosomal protein S27AE
MPDMEKYIEVLSQIVKTAEKFNDYAPIEISLVCVKDILELLKEQEAVQPNDVRKSSSCAYSNRLIGYCKKCGEKINSIDNRSACGKCGQAVKWE